MFDVAIIGNGASAIATLKALVGLSIKKKMSIKVCIVGQISNMGYGFAYNEDTDCAIMNTPATNISIDPEDPLEFIKWSKKNGFTFLGHHNVPRRIYGKYLHDIAMELSTSHHVPIFDTYASDIIKKDGRYEILTLDSKEILADRIVLCAGAPKMNDFYGLSCINGYISNPYPLHRQLSCINTNERILILGSGLTAVDISIYLFYRQHQGKIIFCSREGRLPIVKSIVKPYIPKWCRFDFFVKMAETQRSLLTLRQLLRVVRRELRGVSANWIKIFFPQGTDSESIFIEKVEAARKGLLWLDVLVGIQHEVDQAWAYVRKDHKAFFIKNYLPNILRAIAPIPLKNANILCALFSGEQLDIVGKITTIKKNNDGFIISRANHPPLIVDRIINATGLSRHISLNDENLTSNLIKRKLIYAHSSGGIQVCPKTGQATSDEQIYSVGHLTIGEHPLINNIEFIAMNAKATAAAIVNNIQGEREFYMDKVAAF